VQPIIGKMILPKLGGTPQVWNTCMVFFQTALLAGYFYTHTVSTYLNVRRQVIVHCCLLFVPFLILLPWGPFNVVAWVPPSGGNPAFATLVLLAIVVGIPFFVVATSAPLLQSGSPPPATRPRGIPTSCTGRATSAPCWPCSPTPSSSNRGSTCNRRCTTGSRL